jgi:hypothetical protein
MAESLAERAAHAFQAQPISAPPGIAASIPTNRAFRPDAIDALYGLDPGDNPPEAPIASEALIRGMIEELATIAPALTIQQWIARESAKHGGRGKLAAALLGVPHKGASTNLQYKALLRALQRSSAPTKQGRTEEHKGLSERYQQIVADFPGGALGNPYTLASTRGGALLRVSKAQITIIGNWGISKDYESFKGKGTNLEDASKFEAIWSNPPYLVDFTLEYMRDTYLHDIMPTLEWIYGISLVVILPKA